MEGGERKEWEGRRRKEKNTPLIAATASPDGI